MTLEWIDPIADPRWEEAVRSTRSGVFHSPLWLEVLRHTYGMDPTALLATGEGPVAGIPLVPLGRGRHRRLSSLPFSDYAGPILEGPDAWHQIAGALAGTGVPVRTRTLVAPSLMEADGRFARQGRAHRHVVELGDGRDAWSGLSGSARRTIRKAEKEGVSVRTAAGRHDLRAFYDLHLRVRKHKYRLLAQPFRFFESIWSTFIDRGLGRLMLAEHDGAIIAGTLYLEWDGWWYYKFNASSADAVGLGPNDLLLWSAIDEASSAGAEAICLGLTDWEQDGLRRFKEKYSTRGDVITTFATTADRPLPPSLTRRCANVASKALTDPRVPDTLTERIGSRLYRAFA